MRPYDAPTPSMAIVTQSPWASCPKADGGWTLVTYPATALPLRLSGRELCLGAVSLCIGPKPEWALFTSHQPQAGP